jgi:hypothetical protein
MGGCVLLELEAEEKHLAAHDQPVGQRHVANNKATERMHYAAAPQTDAHGHKDTPRFRIVIISDLPSDQLQAWNMLADCTPRWRRQRGTRL